MTVTEAFSLYCLEEISLKGGSDKTIRNYRSACNSLVSSCTDIPISLLTLDHLTKWQQRCDYLGLSSSTVAHHLSRLKQVLRFMKKRGVDVLDYTLIDRPRVSRPNPTYLVPEEVQRIIEAIQNKRDKAIFACMFDSGARVSELLNLDRADLSGNEARIIGKGDKPGVLRFSEWSMGYLRDYLGTRRDGLRPLFVSSQCRRITVSRVQQLLHVYSDQAGIEKNVTPHVLRHSFATDLLMNGAGIFDVKEQLRHEKISSTEIYLHVEESTRRQTYNRFHTKLTAPGRTDHTREELRRVDDTR